MAKHMELQGGSIPGEICGRNMCPLSSHTLIISHFTRGSSINKSPWTAYSFRDFNETSSRPTGVGLSRTCNQLRLPALLVRYWTKTYFVFLGHQYNFCGKSIFFYFPLSCFDHHDFIFFTYKIIRYISIKIITFFNPFFL